MIYMTSTTNTTKTWTRNIETSTVSWMDDSNFGTFRGGRSYYYNVRGRNGRFVKMVHIDQCEFEIGFHTDEKGISHGRVECTEVEGATHHEAKASGWVCSNCVFVPVPASVLADSVPQTSGSMTCGECCETKSVRKFPTVHVHGVVTRGGTCRQCQSEKREAQRVARRGPWA